MKPRLTVITITVADLERSLHFYRDGLGLPTEGIIGTEFEYGAVAFFEPAVALATAARLAAAVQDAPDLLAAAAVLTGMGVRTELGYERTAGDAAARRR